MANEVTNREQRVEPVASIMAEETIDVKALPLKEEVLNVKRVTKVVKGGRRFSFNALVVVGDENGHIGMGFGKANEVPDAINKAVQNGKKNIFRIPLLGRTIPYEIIGRSGASKVLLKPAAEGTGIIAGPGVRAVVELAGIKDILSKSLGSNNILNVVKATIDGLRSLQQPEKVAAIRGKTLEEVWGKKRAQQYREFIQSLGPPVSVPEAGEAKPPAEEVSSAAEEEIAPDETSKEGGELDAKSPEEEPSK